MLSLKAIAHKLRVHGPRKLAGRRFMRRSAVTLILRDDEKLGVSLLMIQRAERQGDPWSGHMAFPGGMMDKSDTSILAAALRELHEEIGIDSKTSIHYLGRLSDILARAHTGRKPMAVTPFVFQMDAVPALDLNHEVAEVIWVPMGFFIDKKNRQSMRWRYGGVPIKIPCYFYAEKRIWGMSLQMIDDLIQATKMR